MIKLLLMKWFKVEPPVCPVCEVLREQLHRSEAERKELLHRALAPPPIESVSPKDEQQIPIQPQFIPWRVRKEMLEAEDRKQAELLRNKAAEISKLEKELGVSQ